MTEDDLEARVAELEDSLRELRREVRPPPRGPLGLPRPPTPGELARAADEHAIPAAIASLEATIHALELLRMGLRAGSGVESARRSRGTGTRERAERVGDAALARLDDALDDVADALEGTPTDAESAQLLSETERLRAEIEERVREAENPNDGDGDDGSGTVGDGSDTDGSDDGPEVDVEAELQSIKDDQNADPDDGQTGSKR